MDGSDGELPECVSCGGPLTAEEIEYYETTCEKCEQEFLEFMRREHGECYWLAVNTEAKS